MFGQSFETAIRSGGELAGACLSGFLLAVLLMITSADLLRAPLNRFLAFLGGMELSRQYVENGDLLILIGMHWAATFLNTPRYPGKHAA